MKGNRGGRAAATLDVETVSMYQVPNPPLERLGRWGDLYARVKLLGLGERNAVKVRLDDKKQFLAARGRLRRLAEREDLRCLSSRSDDYTVGYFWLVKPE